MKQMLNIAFSSEKAVLFESGEKYIQFCLKVCECYNVPIFLHKYDPEHNQIFAQVLKVDKENPIRQMRQQYFLCHLFCIYTYVFT